MRQLVHAAAALAALTSGCTGLVIEPGARPGTVEAPDGRTIQCPTDRMIIGSAPMRRLSHAEYLNTVADLFPGITVEHGDLPPDTTVEGFENDAAALGPSDVLVARYEETAFRYTSAATASEDAVRTFTGCSAITSEAEQRACGEAFVDRFGLLTHRRPLTVDERARFIALFDQQRAAIDLAAGIQLVAMAMMQMPHFLYRLELSAEEPGQEAVALSDWEVATRLSYFFWQTMPDGELLDAAAAGMLRDEAGIETEARRLLADPRATRAMSDFYRQWLELDRIERSEHASRENDGEGLWTAAAQASTREELSRFVEGVIGGEGTVGALLTSRRAYVNATMAGLYGIDGPAEDDQWSEVELPEAERAGLLTRVGFLASTSHPSHASPPLRGIYVMRRVLCEPPLSPPPDADLSRPEAPPGAEPMTNRQLFEERTAESRCAQCHERIDGYGFAFENYDERGVFRTLDHGLPVDASSRLEGTDVDGAVDGALELSARLASSQTVHACAADRTFRFALGRAIEQEEYCVLDPVIRTFFEEGGHVGELMVALATLPQFRMRPAMSGEEP